MGETVHFTTIPSQHLGNIVQRFLNINPLGMTEPGTSHLRRPLQSQAFKLAAFFLDFVVVNLKPLLQRAYGFTQITDVG